MTLYDAILRSLEEIPNPANNQEVYRHIVAQQYYDFKDAQTPASTVSALLGNFIRNGDSRVKRVPAKGGGYSYYLTKNEQDVSVEVMKEPLEKEEKRPRTASFDERSLHMLLSSYLKGIGIFSKTIFHEQSNSKDSHQKWVHPDMVGVRFMSLHSGSGQALFKAINRLESFELTAFELKKEIKTDYDLKKYYFQAVSNSSWANYGYLVAFDISDILFEEIKRLNQSFGIGIIRLRANPFVSEILFPATHRKLDFITIDKLCRINPNFDNLIGMVEKILTANEKYMDALNRELIAQCDTFFTDEAEAEKYCVAKGVPLPEKPELV